MTALERYRQALVAWTEAPLVEQLSSERRDELDRLWLAMTDEEQDEYERRYHRARASGLTP